MPFVPPFTKKNHFLPFPLITQDLLLSKGTGIYAWRCIKDNHIYSHIKSKVKAHNNHLCLLLWYNHSSCQNHHRFHKHGCLPSWRIRLSSWGLCSSCTWPSRSQAGPAQPEEGHLVTRGIKMHYSFLAQKQITETVPEPLMMVISVPLNLPPSSPLPSIFLLSRHWLPVAWASTFLVLPSML